MFIALSQTKSKFHAIIIAPPFISITYSSKLEILYVHQRAHFICLVGVAAKCQEKSFRFLTASPFEGSYLNKSDCQFSFLLNDLYTV